MRKTHEAILLEEMAHAVEALADGVLALRDLQNKKVDTASFQALQAKVNVTHYSLRKVLKDLEKQGKAIQSLIAKTA